MDGWWDEIESEIAGWLEHRGEASVAELARHLGISEEAMASLLAVVMVGRPVRISRIVFAGASRNVHGDVTIR